jgi:DNA-binding NarL/FixJ family response regulator
MSIVPVLIIDSSPVFLRLLTGVLRHSYNQEIRIIGTAATLDEAFLRCSMTPPDIILVGLGTAAHTNISMISRLREHWPRAGIIVLGLLDTGAYDRQAYADGADAFVRKANLSSELLPAIQQVVRTRQNDEDTTFLQELM